MRHLFTNLRPATFLITGAIVLAGVAWLAAQQIRSPAQIAADTAAPEPSTLTARVERRALTTEVITRGTVAFGSPQSVSLPASELKLTAPIVTRPPRKGATLGEGEVAMSVSGRPVFVLRGAEPMHRDLRPGLEGTDVRQLEQALARAGFDPGTVDRVYDGATAAAVGSLYRARGELPFGLTDTQLEELRVAEEAAGGAKDNLLQMELALKAARTASSADLNQARIDAEAAADAVQATRIALATARSGVAGANADVYAKRSAEGEALDARDQAERDLNEAAPGTPPAERRGLELALRRANAALAAAIADLEAAEEALRAARTELRSTRRSLGIARRSRRLARAQVRILEAPTDLRIEREIVDTARAEASRTEAERQRVALRADIQVPADEILFFDTLPLRVDSSAARLGAEVAGKVMTVTNSRLAIDSSLSLTDSRLVKPGLAVTIDEPGLGISTRGSVTTVADRPGTAGLDPQQVHLRVDPKSVPAKLVGASVRLAIAVESTKRKVLAVPVSALFAAPDGGARVELDLGDGETRAVEVIAGLAAQGYVEIRPRDPRALAEGDLVIVADQGSAATTTPTTTAPSTDTTTPTTTSPTDTGTTPTPPTSTTPTPTTPTPGPTAGPTQGAPGGP